MTSNTICPVAESGIIHGVVVHPLKQFMDHRGGVLHMLRDDTPLFTRFGEIYFSEVNHGAIKAWKKHGRMTQNLAVPVGRVLLAIHDDRHGSPTQGQTMTMLMGRPDHYYLVQIPPMLLYGFQGVGNTPALLANCTDLHHDPDECEQIPRETPNMPAPWVDI